VFSLIIADPPESMKTPKEITRERAVLSYYGRSEGVQETRLSVKLLSKMPMQSDGNLASTAGR
jgi:hypothetical protein